MAQAFPVFSCRKCTPTLQRGQRSSSVVLPMGRTRPRDRGGADGETRRYSPNGPRISEPGQGERFRGMSISRPRAISAHYRMPLSWSDNREAEQAGESYSAASRQATGYQPPAAPCRKALERAQLIDRRRQRWNRSTIPKLDGKTQGAAWCHRIIQVSLESLDRSFDKLVLRQGKSQDQAGHAQDCVCAHHRLEFMWNLAIHSARGLTGKPPKRQRREGSEPVSE
jgi:hypothetical protein